MRYVLTIAGSDSCGGAGIQADIKTITSLGAHAMTAITAVTAQNSLGVKAIHEVPERFISLQIEAVIKDQFPNAVKTGMLPSESSIREVVRVIQENRLEKLVVDPVLRASTGRDLFDVSTLPLLKKLLFPLASLVTPNLDEAGAITGKTIRNQHEMEEAAKEIKDLGPDVIITGGHLEGRCLDLLYDGRDTHRFEGPKIETVNTHGSGCVFSTSLATFLAMGYNTVKAAGLAHRFTRDAIGNAYTCGRGPGPVAPGRQLWKGTR